MGKHPILRAEALTILTPIVAGLIFIIYTFATSYATNARVDRMEDAIHREQVQLRLEMREGFDKLGNKIDQAIVIKGGKK